MMDIRTASRDRSTAGGSEQPFACRAETADCTCPDSCERDHGND